jgi:hypothetical protein
MSLSEILTIIVHFHQSNQRTFKHYYLGYVCTHLSSDFPNMVSYTWFLELMSETSTPLIMLLVGLLASPTTANYIGSTKLVVCHNRRIPRNERGELIFFVTPGNTPDNDIATVTKVAERMSGK